MIPSINNLGLSGVTAVQREQGRHGRGCRRRAWRVQLDLAGGQMQTQMQMQTTIRPFAAAGETTGASKTGSVSVCSGFFPGPGRASGPGCIDRVLPLSVSVDCLASPNQTANRTVPRRRPVSAAANAAADRANPYRDRSCSCSCCLVEGWSGSYLALDA